MAALAALALASAAGYDVALVQSSTSQNWVDLPGLKWGADFPATVDVTVDHTALRQEILGFGGALTDTTAWNVMVGMNETLRDEFLTAWYDAEAGLGYSVVRITLNSADYSVESFNYDNVTDDLDLVHFDRTLAYDNQRVIPLIKLANATAVTKGSGPLKLFASPWSPPGWMKTNGNMIDSAIPCLKNDTAYTAAWAAYIVEWLSAMEAQGIPFWGLTPQNEPLAQQKNFESCFWDGPSMRDFIGTHLGPAVRAAFPHLTIMLYDHNKVAALDYVTSTAEDAVAGAYVDGVALHWYDYFSSLGLDKVAGIAALEWYKASSPATGKPRFMLNTEACDLSNLYLNWTRGELLAVDMLGDLNHGVGGYVEWNHVLHSGYPSSIEGGPNHDGTRDFGNSGVLRVEADGSAAILKQSWYWVMGHVSRFARPGAVALPATGAGVAATLGDYDAVRAYALGTRPGGDAGLPLVASAFLSPDGTTVSVVVLNPSGADVHFKLADVEGGHGTPRAAPAVAPAHSLQTYTYLA